MLHDLTLRAEGFAFADGVGPRPVHLPPVFVQTVFVGTAGDDVLSGTPDADVFKLTDGGADTASGRAGDDVFRFGDKFNAADTVNGGDGFDRVLLDGDYSGGLVLGPATLRNVEQIEVANRNDYFLILDNGNALLRQNFTVDGSRLGFAHGLIVDGSAETSSRLILFGGDGRDELLGGGGSDVLDVGAGGDFAQGGGGDDFITIASGDFSTSDVIDGGTGEDTLALEGGCNVLFNSSTVQNVEFVNLTRDLDGAVTYQFSLNNGNVGTGEQLTVRGGVLDADDRMVVNGVNVVDGQLHLVGGKGEDNLGIGHSGFDTVSAGEGDDTINVFSFLTETNRIDGGDGNDKVVLQASYTDRLTLDSHTIRNVELISMPFNGNYNLKMADGSLAAGQTMTIDASVLTSGRLTFDTSEEANGFYVVTGGAGNDTFRGGALHDDWTSGAGSDRFGYAAPAESTSLNFDTVTDVTFPDDRFDVNGTVTAIDTAVTAGTLDDTSAATFDSQLGIAMSGVLGARHACLFTPDDGTFAGRTFLAVDQNILSGYQSGADLVIEVSGFTGSLTAFMFI